MNRRYANDQERILRNVLVDANGCWLWLRTKQRGGYGITHPSKAAGNLLAHRVSYEAFVGPIPEGLHIDHLCRVRHCVNPEHLEPVTCQENLLRSPLTFQSQNAAKTACKHGHPFDEMNTYIRPNGDRNCRACQRNQRTARTQRAAGIRAP